MASSGHSLPSVPLLCADDVPSWFDCLASRAPAQPWPHSLPRRSLPSLPSPLPSLPSPLPSLPSPPPSSLPQPPPSPGCSSVESPLPLHPPGVMEAATLPAGCRSVGTAPLPVPMAPASPRVVQHGHVATATASHPRVYLAGLRPVPQGAEYATRPGSLSALVARRATRVRGEDAVRTTEAATADATAASTAVAMAAVKEAMAAVKEVHHAAVLRPLRIAES